MTLAQRVKFDPSFFLQFCFCNQNRSNMNKFIFNLLLNGLLLGYLYAFPASDSKTEQANANYLSFVSDPEPSLKQAALEVLQSKCNICHKKRNPFKVFSLRNMEKHAPKIYKQVFIYERMPKGEMRLTNEEYQTLKNWLKSKNIF